MDIQALVGGAAPAPHDAASTLDVAGFDVAALVAAPVAPPPAERRPRNNLGGTVRAQDHARFMRFARAAKRGKSFISSFVKAQIKKANEGFAVRPRDFIDVENMQVTSPVKILGRGRSKQWLPEALLRACFGHPRHAAHRRHRTKQSKEGVPNVQAWSLRSFAYWFRSTHGYVEQVRQAVCTRIFQRQNEQLQALCSGASAHHTICEVALDETEFEINYKGDHAVESVLILHGRLYALYRDGGVYDEELVIPPAFLEDTSADSIFAALTKRTDQLQYNPGRFNVTVLCSDSAKSMIKVARHHAFRARSSQPCRLLPALPRPGGVIELAVHARCMMHMLWAAVCAMFSRYSMASPLYCATTLLHRGQYSREINKAAKRRIMKIPVEYGPKIEPAVYNEHIVTLLDLAQSYAEHEEDGEATDVDKRTALV